MNASQNGPEHYISAERLIDRAANLATGDPDQVPVAQVFATLAVAHANLAAAAATFDVSRTHSPAKAAWDRLLVRPGRAEPVVVPE